MRARRWAVLSVTVLSTAVLGACGVGGESDAGVAEGSEAGTAIERPTPKTPTGDEAADDAAICTAFGDVMTIVANADVGLADGRMETQERDGWYRLATRVLDHLPASGGSDVQTAIGQLQAAAPAASAGTSTDSTGVGSAEWDDAQGALGTACEDLGAPLAISMFTGG